MTHFDQPFEYDNFDVSRDDGVVTVRMDSTNAMNGIGMGFVDEFRDIGMALSEDDGVRAVALTGTDDVYSAGADLGSFAGDESDGLRLRRLASTLHDAIGELLRIRAPLVTAVNGVAAGAGFSLALLGDIVLVSDEARLEYAYTQVGLTGDGGSTFFLPRLVGLRKAREIALLDEAIGPSEAVDLGLASEVVANTDLGDRRRAVTEELASGPTHAYGELKRLLLESFDRGLEEQLAAETEAIAGATATQDYERGYAAFFGEDSPEFEGH
jgi:2-(1,2-epoxy-1,2-dihydrophenyl)acetyl-CoA isomerase